MQRRKTLRNALRSEASADELEVQAFDLKSILMLEADDEVIGVAHDDNVTLRSLPPRVRPEVEHDHTDSWLRLLGLV